MNDNGTHLDVVGRTGCKIAIETAAPITSLFKETKEQMRFAATTEAFELKHRKFLLEREGNYFLNRVDHSLTFFATERDAIKTYFGSEGWYLAAGPAAIKEVDSIKIRLLLGPEEFGQEKIDL